MNSKEWIKGIFQAAAEDFANRCVNGDKRLSPLTEWEAQRLQEGVAKGIFDISGSIFKTEGGTKEYKFFGLNREYFTHFAMLVEALSWDLPNARIEFEYKQLDLMIFNNEQPYIGIEVKKSRKDAEILVADIFRQLPNPDLNKHDRGMDGLRKIKYLLEIKPKEFWIVSPEMRWKFEVSYSTSNIELKLFEGPEIKQVA